MTVLDPMAEINAIIRDLAARCTVEAYRQHGPLRPSELEQAARELNWLGADLARRGYTLAGNQALVLADRLEETAELTRLMRRPDAA